MESKVKRKSLLALCLLALVLLACKVTELPDKTMVELCEAALFPAILAVVSLR